jgi:hypothetical protein
MQTETTEIPTAIINNLGPSVARAIEWQTQVFELLNDGRARGPKEILNAMRGTKPTYGTLAAFMRTIAKDKQSPIRPVERGVYGILSRAARGKTSNGSGSVRRGRNVSNRTARATSR